MALPVSHIIESIFTFVLLHFSKQHNNLSEYLKDAINRAIHEDPLYKSPIVYLPPPQSHKSYEDLISLNFQPKQRKSDIWNQEEISLLLTSLTQLKNNQIVPQVIHNVIFYLLGAKYSLFYCSLYIF